MDIWLTADAWFALLTLAFLEVVLGIDNIIFISLICDKLPREKQERARIIGLTLALILRVGMLIGISYMMQMKNALFTVYEHPVSLRDILLFAGGLFLLAKSTTEMHEKVQGEKDEVRTKFTSYGMVILQIIVFDLVFSLDSVLTAVGMVDEVSIMIAAVVIAMIVMIVFAKRVSNFINNRPTLQILALSFLILIGFMLVLDGMHFEIPKGYIYFAVFFSLMVEMLNLRLGKNRKKGKAAKEDKGSEGV